MPNNERKARSQLQREIAKRLLMLRELFHPNASEMARSINLSPQSWYNYETGRRTLEARVAHKLVEQYLVDFNFIYGGTTDTLDRKVRLALLEQLAKPVTPKKKRRKRRARAKVATAEKPPPA